MKQLIYHFYQFACFDIILQMSDLKTIIQLSFRGYSYFIFLQQIVSLILTLTIQLNQFSFYLEQNFQDNKYCSQHMGQNQSCPNIQQKCIPRKDHSYDFNEPLASEQFQEYDNPSRNIFKTNFLNSKKQITNDLNRIDTAKEIQSVPQISSKRFSLFKIDSINLDQNTPEAIDFDDRVKQSIKTKRATNMSDNMLESQLKKRTSICDNLDNFPQIQTKKRTSICQNLAQSQKRKGTIKQNNILQEDLQKSLYQNLKKYVASKRNIYNQIQIKSEKFIQLRQIDDINEYYKIGQKIGEGSFGNVFKAICLKTSNLRAIKVLKRKSHKKKLENLQKIKQTIAQIEILRKLDHPNIIKIFDVYYCNDSYYIITEFCAGGSIMSYLRQNNGYCENIVKAIMRQLLSAVCYLHSQKIAHRDLKLENVVFIKKISQQSKTEDVQIKIIDFGSALQMQYSHNNKDKKLIGTINYMAPEVIEGSYSDKCDVWSCGIIMHILLTGKSPFKKWNKQQTIKSIQSAELKFVDSDWQQVSASAKILISKMLQKQPLRRISAKHALKNSWLSQSQKQTLQKQTMEKIVKKLYNYYRGNNLVSVLQAFLTFLHVTQQQRSQLSKLFKILDKDSSGTIQIAQLKEAFILYKDQDVSDQIDYILSKIDRNKSKKIDLSEFISAMYDREKLFHQNSLEMAFNYFDADGNGVIDKKQLKSVLKGCDKKQIQILLKDLDQNGDDKISKQQFKNYFLQKRFL